jgi:hypothetical protein
MRQDFWLFFRGKTEKKNRPLGNLTRKMPAPMVGAILRVEAGGEKHERRGNHVGWGLGGHAFPPLPPSTQKKTTTNSADSALDSLGNPTRSLHSFIAHRCRPPRAS